MKEQMPCIAHVVIDEMLSHFVVVYKIDAQKVRIGNPGKGVYNLSQEVLDKIWKKFSFFVTHYN